MYFVGWCPCPHALPVYLMGADKLFGPISLLIIGNIVKFSIYAGCRRVELEPLPVADFIESQVLLFGVL